MIRNERGYAMAALLVALGVMAVVMSVAMPVWNTAARREKEAELIFRGEQYARAIALFQRRYPGAYPPNLDILLSEKFLRKRYRDPVTNDDFQLIPVGAAIPGLQTPPPVQGGRGQQAAGAQQGQQAGRGRANAGVVVNQGAPGTIQGGAGIQGVVSKSSAQSLRLFNGRDRYDEWAFVAVAATAQPGDAANGTAAPGVPGRGGAPGRGAQPGRGVQPGQRGQQPQQQGIPGLGGRFGQPQPEQPGGRRGF